MSLFEQLIQKAKFELKNAAKDAVDDAAQKIKEASQTTKVKISKLPLNAEEMKAMKEFDLKDPYKVAALVICALNRYPEDQNACFEMLDLLNGPNELSPRDKQFVDERFMDGKDYVPRSYFVGATPENNYTPETDPYKIAIMENDHSWNQENYCYLYPISNGADSPRQIQLRCKPSTKEWFIWSFEGLLMDIRIPKEADPWA